MGTLAETLLLPPPHPTPPTPTYPPTTWQVSMARVYNYDVTRRKEQGSSGTA